MNFNEPAIRLHIAQNLDVAPDTIEFIRGFENIVFRQRFPSYPLATPGRTTRILRLTEPSHRSRAQLQAESAWVLDLAARGLPVARPLPWRGGPMIEELVIDDVTYWAMAFELAPGTFADSRDESVWNTALFETWGETLSLLHESARQYEPAPGLSRRPHWHEDDLVHPERYLGDADEAVIRACHDIFDELRDLPTSTADYGLIHNDLHSGNFFVHQGRMMLFDFDDACYHWFANDIVTALYAPCWWTIGRDAPEHLAFAESFITALLRGYRRHSELPSSWLDAMPRFLRYRDALNYTVILKHMDVTTLAPQLERELAACRARLLGAPAPVELDFQAWA